MRKGSRTASDDSGRREHGIRWRSASADDVGEWRHSACGICGAECDEVRRVGGAVGGPEYRCEVSTERNNTHCSSGEGRPVEDEGYRFFLSTELFAPVEDEGALQRAMEPFDQDDEKLRAPDMHEARDDGPSAMSPDRPEQGGEAGAPRETTRAICGFVRGVCLWSCTRRSAPGEQGREGRGGDPVQLPVLAGGQHRDQGRREGLQLR